MMSVRGSKGSIIEVANTACCREAGLCVCQRTTGFYGTVDATISHQRPGARLELSPARQKPAT